MNDISNNNILYCNNCAIQERKYPLLTVFESENCGYGLKTLSNINKNTILCEYTGEVIDSKERNIRMSKYINKDAFYFASLGDGYYLDAKIYGNIYNFYIILC